MADTWSETRTKRPGEQDVLFLDSGGEQITGGASRDRTDDPLLAKQVLSQLSYGP
jgi:hypothetical protein